MMQLVKLEKIRLDCGTQSRCALNEPTINDYAEMMEDGAEFPPVYIVHDGNNYYLADGFHRYFANKKNGKKEIKAEVVNGTLTEAILYSKNANGKHGLPFTTEDKRKNVQEMLDHFEFGDWSDREIARRCCVSNTMVSSMRTVKRETVKYKKDGKVIEQKIKPKAEKKKKEDQVSELTDDQSAVIDMLSSENSRLVEEMEKIKDELNIKNYDATPEEKVIALQTIEELREEIRKLNIDLVAVKKSRDQYQNENAALKRQIAAINKKNKQ
jgi:ParB-like chromosome segregation protein Spo0J